MSLNTMNKDVCAQGALFSQLSLHEWKICLWMGRLCLLHTSFQILSLKNGSLLCGFLTASIWVS